MQLKTQNLILLVTCVLSVSVSGHRVNASTESESSLTTSQGQDQKDQNDNRKKIIQLLKSVIKGIKHITLALLSAGSAIAGAEYIWWRLARNLGHEERKIILFQHTIIATSTVDALELKIDRLKVRGKLNEHTYQLMSKFVALARSRININSGNYSNFSKGHVISSVLRNQYETVLKQHSGYEIELENLFPEIEKIISIL